MIGGGLEVKFVRSLQAKPRSDLNAQVGQHGRPCHVIWDGK